MLNTIDEAIIAIQQGMPVIVVDDEDRENEGDFITSAINATPEMVNFMARYGRGLICAALTEERCQELNLHMMVPDNTSLHETAFTVSIDLLGNGCTTGISAHDRSKTLKALADKNTKATDFGRPGHIFPLKAKAGGVLRRSGHTEAAVDLARLAGHPPAGVLVEIMNEDGSMARLPELIKMAAEFGLKIITIKDLIDYRLQKDNLIKEIERVQMPTKYGSFELIAFEQQNTGEIHLAMKKGNWMPGEPVLVRVHSSCMTGDILGSLRCDCGDQLHHALQQIEHEGQGLLLYMNQEGRGIGLLNKLRAYKLQEQGYDTVDANLKLGFGVDERDYGIGAQILRSLGITKMKLLSNNPRKRAGLQGYGLEVVDTVPIQVPANPFNQNYLQTKKDKLGHNLFDIIK